MSGAVASNNSPSSIVGERVVRFLKKTVWPTIPKKFLGRRPTRAEEDAILGYGPEGV